MIILLWLLTLSGVAWAYDCNVCSEPTADGVIHCTLLQCWPPKQSSMDSCYQRMQAAIRMVEQARDHEGKNITYIIEGVEYTRWSLTEPQRHLWLDVVEQCVEER